MAEASADASTGGKLGEPLPSPGNLEQKIRQVLDEAGCPVKIAKLVKECQVPKKALNQVLYRLKNEGKVHSPAPATWCLGGDAPGNESLAIREDPSVQPSLDERILRFLETSGPHKALHIAQALGMKTAKEVNPHLYAMRDRHLLSYDRNTWMIYDSSPKGQELAHPGVRRERPMIIYQQNPTNMICQQGAFNHISIAESQAIQIGHGNIMQRQPACDPSGPGPHHPLPLPVPEDPSSQDIPVGDWGAQHIHMEKSMLRRVQLGHGNEMSLRVDPVEHTDYSFSGSPPGIMAPTTPLIQSLCKKRSMMGNSFHPYPWEGNL